MPSAVPTIHPTIGVISDTHGLVRPEVASVFRGVDMIVHAGDIGSMAVVTSLEKIAPVTAVSGNIDSGLIAAFLNDVESFQFHGFGFYLLHDLSHLAIDPAASGIHMVISGHTHMPHMRTENGVMYLNPGSAGPERSKKPISLARVSLDDGRLRVRHFTL